MRTTLRISNTLYVFLLASGLIVPVSGRAQAPDAAGAAAPKPAAAPAAGAKKAPFRAIVQGVEHTILTDRHEQETFAVHDVVELTAGMPGLKWAPKLYPTSGTLAEKATATTFRREIWGLEFTFKPVRMLWVDEPQPTGKMQQKLVWYLIYHVKNPGGHLKPVQGKDGTWTVQKSNSPVTFEPHMVIHSPEYNKGYLDRVIPVAIPAIMAKEDPQRKLLNSVEMAAKPIAVSTDTVDNSVWGVATWVDLDAKIDVFSVSIQGLTNAYKWEDPPAAAVKPGDPPGKGRTMTHKTLVLNFWRPGDEFLEDKRMIQYGVPGQVDYSWVYR
jgi:hypothetical protein